MSLDRTVVKEGFFPTSMPSSAKALILAVIVTGSGLFFYALFAALQADSSSWMGLVALTAAASWFAIKIPLLKASKHSVSLTLSDTFIFAAILLFGPAVAVLVAVTEGLVSSLRVGVRRGHKWLFNLGQLALAAFVAGWIFKLVGTTITVPQTNLPEISGTLVSILLSSAIYFILNSTIVGGVIALVSGQTFAALWTKHFLWASPSNLANAAAAGSAVTYINSLDLALALAVPLVLIIFSAHRIHSEYVRQTLASA